VAVVCLGSLAPPILEVDVAFIIPIAEVLPLVGVVPPLTGVLPPPTVGYAFPVALVGVAPGFY